MVEAQNINTLHLPLLFRFINPMQEDLLRL